MKNHPNRLWLVVLLIAWVFDQLFWGIKPGVSFALFTVALLTGGMGLLWSFGIRPERRIWVLVPFILFFAGMTFFRSEPLTVFLNVVLTITLLMILALTYLGGRWTSYSLLDYIAGVFRLAFATVSEPVKFQLDVQKQRAESGEAAPKMPIWPVLRGILLALPVLMVFTVLLAAADAVFESQLTNLVELFSLEKLPEYITRVIFIAMLGFAIAGVLLYAALRSNDDQLIGEEKPSVPAFLGITESIIVLGSVAALFIFFLIIQFQYFFGGQANIHIEGYTYAEYARRGFGELVTVAFFTLLMIFTLSAFTRRDSETHQKIFSGVSILLVAQVMVMLVSAYQRLVLYEEAYGFSRLRTYTHVFMIWLGALLLVTVGLEVLKRQRAFALCALIASLGFVASLNILNVDAFIVDQNLRRTQSADGLDTLTIATLSADATPRLLAAYQDKSLPESVRTGAAAALFCRYAYRAENYKGATYTPTAWQSYHWAEAQQAPAFAVARTLPFSKDEHGRWIVVSDDGTYYSCTGYSE